MLNQAGSIRRLEERWNVLFSGSDNSEIARRGWAEVKSHATPGRDRIETRGPHNLSVSRFNLGVEADDCSGRGRRGNWRYFGRTGL